MVIVMVSFDRGFLDGPVHAFDLSVGARVLGFGQAVLDPVLQAQISKGPIEHVGHVGGCGSVFISWREGELDTPFDCLPAAVAQDRIVGQHSVDCIGHCFDQGCQESCCSHPTGFLGELYKNERTGPVDRYGKIEFAPSCADLSDIAVEVSDWIGFERLLGFLVAFDIWQAGDVMSLKTAMQGRAREMRDGCLQGLKAVIERQQCMLAKGNDDRFFLNA